MDVILEIVNVLTEDGQGFKQKKTISTVISGVGSIKVWEYFSANGTGNISVIFGRMNAAAHLNILEAKLIISVENLDFPLIGFSKKIMTQSTLQNLRKHGFMKVM